MAALENEVLRNPKPSLVDRSVLELSADRLVPPDIYVDRAVLMAGMGYDDVCEAGGALRGLKSPWSEPPNSDLELVAEARARFLDLQNEAETLEEAYRSYQQRAVRSTISHMLPQRPLSPHHAQHPGSSLRKRTSHLSNPYSPHQSKISHRPLSPQTTKISSSAPYDTRNTLPPAQARVTFLEDQCRPTSQGLFTEQSVHSWDEPLFSRDGHPQDEQSPPFRRLSSTPQSRRKLQGETAEGTFKDNLLCHNTYKHLIYRRL